MDDMPRNFWYRLFEILPGAISWLILIGPFVTAYFFPRAIAIFIVIYVLLWFLRSLKSSAFLVHSYFRSKRFAALDWNRLLDFFSDNPPVPQNKMEYETCARIDELKQKGNYKKSSGIYHVVIMPTYKEEKEILESSIEAITQADFPLERIFFVLATEERDRMRAETNAAYLERRFEGIFAGFFHFMHPANIEGEIAAKGANISYAAAKIAEVLHDRGIDFSNVPVTTLDADNRPHTAYFSNLTYHYLMEPERDKRAFEPLSFFYNNIWDVPFSNRLIALVNTFWYLSESGESHHLFNAAVYAQSMDSLVKMDFWSRQTIVEDLHQFWRSWFYFKGEYKVTPIFVPVYQDALQNRTYFTSLTGQYKQLRRWAWGASEIAYVAVKLWRGRASVPAIRTLRRLGYMWYLQCMWATAPVIILLNKFIPTVINPRFANSLFAYNLGAIFNVIFTVLVAGIIISLLVSSFSLPRPARRAQSFSLIFQWLLLPFVTIIYGAIPAIDAQTRLMLGKRLGFEVTEKVRKS